MKKINMKFLLTILAVGFLLSCATRKEIVRFKDDTTYLRQQIFALRQENKEIKKMLKKLTATLILLQDGTRKTKADLLSELESLKTQSNVIDSKLADSASRISDFFQRVESLSQSQFRADSLQADSLVQTGKIPPNANGGFDPKTIYKTAYMDLSRGNYQLAIQGFQEYLKRFPDSEFSDNAQYWIGEIFYARRDFQQAIQQFEKVVTNYPDGDKAAAALLKIGYSYYNMNNYAAAKKYLGLVIQRFPRTEEAKLAQSRLSSIK